VAGVDCGGCVIGTRAALRKLEGVQQADASYDDATGKGTAWALYDPAKVTPERMMAAIRELGYTPTLVEATG
jgi:copper chaperone CopZ